MSRTVTSLIFLLVLSFAGYGRVRYDTTYIQRPVNSWVFRTRTEVGMGSIRSAFAHGDNHYHLEFTGNTKLRQHIGFGYGRFILGFGINLSGKKVGWDTAINFLGNRFGMELAFSELNAGAGHLSLNDIIYPIPENGRFKQFSLTMRTYTAFNGKKFSMPAVLTQKFRQKKSAGSGLFTTALTTFWLLRKDGTGTTMPLTMEHIGFAGLGGGYGYNWVPSQKWLLHLSATENVGVPWQLFETNGGNFDAPIKVPAFLTAGRASIFFYPGRWYLGLSATTEYYLSPAPKNSAFKTEMLDIRALATIGVHF